MAEKQIEQKAKVVSWVEYWYKREMAELGKNVAYFLDKMWGLHNLNRRSLGKVDWSNDTWLEVVIDRPLSTVDNNDLTRLVVIAHQMMLRVDLKGCGPGYVKLMFHQRKSRNKDDGIYQWCPDIHEHVNMIAEYHPAIDKAI